jgi:hypothetical protein
MVDDGGEHAGADRVQVMDSGQIADQCIGLLTQVLQERVLDLGDAEQVDAAGQGDDQAAVGGGVLDLHGPPPGGGRRSVGLPTQGSPVG